MAALLTNVNRFAARIQSTQPVDNSGEKFGATGGQPGNLGGEQANNPCASARSPQPGKAGRAASHKPCGRGIAVLPGPMAVVPTIHRAYCDYGSLSFKEQNNQQWVRGGAGLPGNPGSGPARTSGGPASWTVSTQIPP